MSPLLSDPSSVLMRTIETEHLRATILLPLSADGLAVELRILDAAIVRPTPTTALEPALLLHAIRRLLPDELECEERTLEQTRLDLAGIVEDMLVEFVDDLLDPAPEDLAEIQAAADLAAVDLGIRTLAAPAPVF